MFYYITRMVPATQGLIKNIGTLWHESRAWLCPPTSAIADRASAPIISEMTYCPPERRLLLFHAVTL